MGSPVRPTASTDFLIRFLAVLDMIWSTFSALLPIVVLLWIAARIVARRERAWWWVVASLPFMGIPIYVFAEIAAACAHGNGL